MGSRIINFIKYNNAFTIAFIMLFISTGTIFAANDELRESVISQEERIITVDNSIIRTVDLSNYDPAVQVLEVTEDGTNFYVSYTMNTIEVVDGVWVEVSNEEMLTVAKEALGQRDLGLYVAEEIQEVTDQQLSYLKEVQEIEQTIGTTPRVTLTEYDGLVGKMFDPAQATFIGYKPVIPEKKVPLNKQSNSNELAGAVTKAQRPPAETPDPVSNGNTNIPSASPTPGTSAGTTTTSVDTTAPIITLLGTTEANVLVGSEYVDAGATAIDDVDGDVSNDLELTTTVNTSAAGVYYVTYSVSDQAGNTAEAIRTVTVTAPTTDETPPAITLRGSKTMNLEVNDTYNEPGATASDETDGDISDTIAIDTTVDTTEPGTYTVTYTATDQAGNTVSANRTIVVAAPAEPETATPDTAE